MDEKQVRKILGDWIIVDNLYDLGKYLDWKPDYTSAILDGDFTADELEAITWWMRNKGD